MKSRVNKCGKCGFSKREQKSNSMEKFSNQVLNRIEYLWRTRIAFASKHTEQWNEVKMQELNILQ